MSKTLDDILGTPDTAVPEKLAADAIPGEAQPAAENEDAKTPNAANKAESTPAADVADEENLQPLATGAEDDTVIEVPQPAATDADEQITEVVSELDDFHPYLKSIIRPVVLYGNKYCTKPQGRFSGTVKVIEPPENGVALVEYMIITNGARRKMKAYIHI